MMESDICCPYCGYELEDSWEWNDETEATCPSCKREFELEVKTEVSYTTRRSSWDMPSDYPYMTEEQRQEVESGFIE